MRVLGGGCFNFYIDTFIDSGDEYVKRRTSLPDGKEHRGSFTKIRRKKKPEKRK